MAPRRRSDVALQDQILAIVRDASWPLSSREVARRLGVRVETYRARPPYRYRPSPVAGHGYNAFGQSCCPGCTDATHIVRQAFFFDARHVLPHLRALEAAGFIEGVARPRRDGKPAAFYWRPAGPPLTDDELRRLMEGG